MQLAAPFMMLVEEKPRIRAGAEPPSVVNRRQQGALGGSRWKPGGVPGVGCQAWVGGAAAAWLSPQGGQGSPRQSSGCAAKRPPHQLLPSGISTTDPAPFD